MNKNKHANRKHAKRHKRVQKQTNKPDNNTTNKRQMQKEKQPNKQKQTTINNIHAHVYKQTSITIHTTNKRHKHGQKHQTNNHNIAQQKTRSCTNTHKQGEPIT